MKCYKCEKEISKESCLCCRVCGGVYCKECDGGLCDCLGELGYLS